jgi:AcrR family transcriptional regulator
MATRWGVDAPTTEAEARERILEAAGRCYQHRGVIATTMDAIAREANIHRTTVYSYFRNRNAILEGVLLRELRPVAARTEQVMSDPGPFVDRMAETLAVAARAIEASPLLSLLYSKENVTYAHRTTSASEQLQSRTHRALTRHVTAAVATGELRDDIPAGAITSWLMEINDMLLGDADRRHEGDYTAVMRTFVAPSIVASAASTGGR